MVLQSQFHCLQQRLRGVRLLARLLLLHLLRRMRPSERIARLASAERQRHRHTFEVTIPRILTALGVTSGGLPLPEFGANRLTPTRSQSPRILLFTTVRKPPQIHTSCQNPPRTKRNLVGEVSLSVKRTEIRDPVSSLLIRSLRMITLTSLRP